VRGSSGLAGVYMGIQLNCAEQSLDFCIAKAEVEPNPDVD